MTSILRKIGKAWGWIWSNLGTIIMVAFLALWLYSDVLVTQEVMDNKTEAFECSTLCFPQQSELIVNGEASSCWCYVDNDTIVRSIYKTNQ